MRNGIWALYNGKEFEIIEHGNNSYELFTKDSSMRNFGFVLDNTGHYCKHVMRDEIQSAYEIRYFARYRGKEFPVFQEEENKVLIGSGGHGPDIIKDYSFVQVDRFEYEKWVAKNEIEQLYEVKIPVWGFTNV